LRREAALAGTDGLLPPEDVASLASTENVLSELLDPQTRDLRRAHDAGWLGSHQPVTFEGSLTRLTDHMGRCKRIRNMGFPAHCGYLASRIPRPFALPVPWSPGRDLVWWTLPVGVAVVLTRWMIWVIGVELAEPLENRPTHTPMTCLSEKIEGGLRRPLGEAALPLEYAVDGGVLM
jgi:putative membrane protein